jgi:hypothetical protein
VLTRNICKNYSEILFVKVFSRFFCVIEHSNNRLKSNGFLLTKSVEKRNVYTFGKLTRKYLLVVFREDTEVFFRVPVTENSYNEAQRGYFPGGHRKIERKSKGVFQFLRRKAGIFSVMKVFSRSLSQVTFSDSC